MRVVSHLKHDRRHEIGGGLACRLDLYSFEDYKEVVTLSFGSTLQGEEE